MIIVSLFFWFWSVCRAFLFLLFLLHETFLQIPETVQDTLILVGEGYTRVPGDQSLFSLFFRSTRVSGKKYCSLLFQSKHSHSFIVSGHF